MRPVVAVAGIEIAHHFQQSRVLLKAVFPVEITDGQRRGDDFGGVFNTVFFQYVSKLGAGVDDVLHADEIVNQHHPVGIFDRRPGEDLFILQIDHRFNHVLTVKHHHIGGARCIYRRAFQGKFPYGFFIRFMQRNFGEAGIRLEFRRGFDDSDRFANLGG